MSVVRLLLLLLLKMQMLCLSSAWHHPSLVLLCNTRENVQEKLQKSLDYSLDFLQPIP